MKKILLVDDDLDFCEATKLILESKAFKVSLAYDGKEGLNMARSEQPDLVILDVMMPEMNGYDVCVVMKADPELNRIPVILLTAVSQEMFKTSFTKEMGLMTEADDYIAKPVEPEELVERIEVLLKREE
ncbi:MAG: response regulator transcription factor [Proteobacteria bacterium]|nr:response regulator transcription factor [Desulfobacteraceae bacterium]MBU3980414.1 response regulator transcription factor [Pseudomonadota bacterium]MBU4013239.1 response regulator transcription factor [Pseudomonadota bacterium]MBU4067874.1 response regulator transcription factor [Pseudomonadota bacterium]MBU4101479.1 response regulator transcription factor [Pseudomonadota bacterium]